MSSCSQAKIAVVGLFQPITNSDHLPPVGANAENLGLDIKTVDKGDSFERAKDVAAFANASGGVLLVGAAEDLERGTLATYVPMEQDQAKQVCEAFNRATRDLCSPKPVIDPVIIACQNKFVVAINVWPFPGQAVGVRYNQGPLCFAFPFRTGTHTIWLTAEQLPMLMVPEIRRVIILLDAISQGSGLQLSSSSGHHWDSTLKQMNPLENSLMLEVMIGEKPMPSSLPLDSIRSVWRDATRGWCLTFQGDFTFLDDNKILIYKP